jgi:hypothetical protein
MMMLLLLLLLCTIDGDGFWLRLAAAADVHGPLSLFVSILMMMMMMTVILLFY